MSKEITDELKKLNKLMGIFVTQNMGFNDKIITFKKCGFSVQEISEITGATKGTISVQFTKLKNDKKNKVKNASKTKS